MKVNKVWVQILGYGLYEREIVVDSVRSSLATAHKAPWLRRPRIAIEAIITMILRIGKMVYRLTSPSSCASRALRFRRSFCSAFFSTFCFWYSWLRLALLPTVERLVGIFPNDLAVENFPHESTTAKRAETSAALGLPACFCWACFRKGM